MNENVLAKEVKESTHISNIIMHAKSRLEAIRYIAQRLEAMRQRLIGDTDHGVEAESVPEPVRPEIQELEHVVEQQRLLLERCLNDLNALEQI